MKIRRKIYAVLLTAALILTLLPAMAFAEGEEGVEPVDAWFSGTLWADVGDTDVNGMYLTKDGSSAIDVRYTDDITVNPVTFTYIEQEITDEYGDTMLRCGFLRDGADPDKDESYAYAFIDYENLSPIAAGANEIPIIISVPYIDPDTGDLEYKEFNTTYHMWVSVERPLSVDFIPAPGFTLKGAVGYNFLNEEDFYGEGNKFRVSIEEPVDPEVFPDDPSPMVITVDYTYVKTEDGVEGFFDNANPEYERFDMTNGVECYLNKGMNRGVEMTYYAYVKGEEDPIELPLVVDIDADKYGLYADDSYIATYTGKNITRSALKFRLYNTNGRLISSKEYTYTTPKVKSMGWHYMKVRIKDEYKDKYNEDTVLVRYGIGPRIPKMSGLVSGKGKATVKWKKMTSSQLKKIDGFYVMVSTDKEFLNNTKRFRISKKEFKSGKSVIKNLKKIKGYNGYYVKAYSYKVVKQNGQKIKMPSAESPVMFVKVK